MKDEILERLHADDVKIKIEKISKILNEIRDNKIEYLYSNYALNKNEIDDWKKLDLDSTSLHKEFLDSIDIEFVDLYKFLSLQFSYYIQGKLYIKELSNKKIKYSHKNNNFSDFYETNTPVTRNYANNFIENFLSKSGYFMFNSHSYTNDVNRYSKFFENENQIFHVYLEYLLKRIELTLYQCHKTSSIDSSMLDINHIKNKRINEVSIKIYDWRKNDLIINYIKESLLSGYRFSRDYYCGDLKNSCYYTKIVTDNINIIKKLNSYDGITTYKEDENTYKIYYHKLYDDKKIKNILSMYDSFVLDIEDYIAIPPKLIDE